VGNEAHRIGRQTFPSAADCTSGERNAPPADPPSMRGLTFRTSAGPRRSPSARPPAPPSALPPPSEPR
jgi:hypothetical protein